PRLRSKGRTLVLARIADHQGRHLAVSLAVPRYSERGGVRLAHPTCTLRDRYEPVLHLSGGDRNLDEAGCLSISRDGVGSALAAGGAVLDLDVVGAAPSPRLFVIREAGAGTPARTLRRLSRLVDRIGLASQLRGSSQGRRICCLFQLGIGDLGPGQVEDKGGDGDHRKTPDPEPHRNRALVVTSTPRQP